MSGRGGHYAQTIKNINQPYYLLFSETGLAVPATVTDNTSRCVAEGARDSQRGYTAE